jgi:hypothetical protein
MSPSTVPTQQTYSIASIPADGIGTEVLDAGIKVLDTLSETLGTFKFDFKHYDWSSETYKKTGKYIPDGGLDELKKHDAILFGAVGAPGNRNSSYEFPCKPDNVQTYPTTSPSGASGSQSARPSSNTPTSDQPRSSEGRNLPYGTARRKTSTGSSSARTAKASTPARAAARIVVNHGRPPQK